MLAALPGAAAPRGPPAPPRPGPRVAAPPRGRPRRGRPGPTARAAAEGAAAAAAAAVAAAGRRRVGPAAGLRYFRYHSAFPHPKPAKEIYSSRPTGSGWPEQCPPIKAAQAFGWDVINPLDIEFVYGEDGWEIAEVTEVDGDDLRVRSGVKPHDQDNAWVWDPNQALPHKISPHVYPEIRHQVKVSTFLFLKTPPGWAVLQSDIPNLQRPFRVLAALLDTDWYFPAHPWHCVLELPRGRRERGERVLIPGGEPLCRLTPVRRGAYAAAEMDAQEFTESFATGQRWLVENGRPTEDPATGETVQDIRGAYARQQRTASFAVAAASPRAAAAAAAAPSRPRAARARAPGAA